MIDSIDRGERPVMLTYEKVTTLSGRARRDSANPNQLRTELRSKAFESEYAARTYIRENAHSGRTYTIWSKPTEFHVVVERRCVQGGAE